MSTPYSGDDPTQQQPGAPNPQGGYIPYPPQPPYGQPGGQQGYAPPGGYAPAGYLQGAPVGFGTAISEAFRNMFNYQGRASRSAYWWFSLFQFIVEIALAIIAAASKSVPLVILVYLVIIAFSLLVGLPLTVRRLHDQDKSGFWYFIVFIPFLVGPIWLLVLTCLKGTPGPNRFG